MRKSAIIKAFGAAADRYEGAAELQRGVAQEVAQRIAALPLPESPRILEIGCGTGFLTGFSAPYLPGAQWICSDIAPEMVARTRSTLSFDASFVVMDGEFPSFTTDAGFDLICSSLAAQWFLTPRARFRAAGGLLNPGGYLILSTLGEDSFSEWHALTRDRRGGSGVGLYPNADTWHQDMPQDGISHVEERWHPIAYPDAFAFLSALKQIGAGTPRPGHRPLGAGELRRVLRGVEGPFVATYHIVFATYRHGIQALP